MGNVLLFVDVQDGVVSKSGLEILTAGCNLASAIGLGVNAVLVGPGANQAAAQIANKGAKVVYTADNPALADFNPDLYTACLEAAAEKADAKVILFCADTLGRDLAPRLAFRLGAALITEAVTFTAEDSRIKWTRPVYGGKAMAVIAAERDVQVVTIRAHSFDPAAAEGDAGEVVALDINLDAIATAIRVVDHIREAVEGIKLEDAKVVISGGRGLGGPEQFKELESLANIFGGAVGATRAACDAGWVPSSWQVGQTGKIVAPDLYIAIGISGASQHITGIANAKVVVAINKDEEAPIFKRANFGIVADYKTVLPHLVEQCRQLMS